LRAFNLSVMTWRSDGTGNLYQKLDGSWWVRFDHSYLKNHLSAVKGRPFDVPLHRSLWPYVEKFLFTHRPHLTGAGVCDYVFRPGLARKAKRVLQDGRAVERHVLSKQIFTLTQRYIPDCPGFGIHTFRHLVATEYIKNNPAGYAVAAAVLNDQEETVRKNYAWVVPADKFAFWNDYVSTLLSARVEEDDDQGEDDDE
jgi:integrase